MAWFDRNGMCFVVMCLESDNLMTGVCRFVFDFLVLIYKEWVCVGGLK